MDLQVQDEKQWCWAAVAVSIHNFLNPGGTNWEQGDVATPVLFGEHQIGSDIDCSATPGKCNFPAALDEALRETGNLKRDGFRRNEYLTFDNIKGWVALDLPIGVRILWWGGGAHFVVIDGFRVLNDGREQVHVQDPRGFAGYRDYDVLVSGYSDGGDWQDTYLVKPSTTPPPDGGV